MSTISHQPASRRPIPARRPRRPAVTARRRRQRPASFARGAAVAEINITPMVDVLLCLLILVMVIQPGLLKGLDVQVPPPETGEISATAPRDQLILHVGPGPAYTLNGIGIPSGQLEGKIREVFNDRARKVLFVKGTEDAVYADVVDAVDRARGAGVKVIGLVPRQPLPDSAGRQEAAPPGR
jgi:biopolymer transport protein ExbD